MLKQKAKFAGYRCIYCGVIFQEVHPDSIEFINGYPSPCRKIDSSAIVWVRIGERPELWMWSEIEYLPASRA